MEIEGLMNGDWQEIEERDQEREEGWTSGSQWLNGRLIWNEFEEPGQVKATIYITAPEYSSHLLMNNPSVKKRTEEKTSGEDSRGKKKQVLKIKFVEYCRVLVAHKTNCVLHVLHVKVLLQYTWSIVTLHILHFKRYQEHPILYHIPWTWLTENCWRHAVNLCRPYKLYEKCFTFFFL